MAELRKTILLLVDSAHKYTVVAAKQVNVKSSRKQYIRFPKFIVQGLQSYS